MADIFNFTFKLSKPENRDWNVDVNKRWYLHIRTNHLSKADEVILSNHKKSFSRFCRQSGISNLNFYQILSCLFILGNHVCVLHVMSCQIVWHFTASFVAQDTMVNLMWQRHCSQDVPLSAPLSVPVTSVRCAVLVVSITLWLLVHRSRPQTVRHKMVSQRQSNNVTT